MRDVLLALVVFGSLPFILRRPYIGVLVFAWLGYMNPHRLAYGFAFTFPWVMIVAATTMVALFVSNESKRIPWSRTTLYWALLIFWMNVTTLFALNPEGAHPEWLRTMKVQLLTLVTMLLIRDRFRIEALVWVITASIGFYGTKGGLFSLLTGGEYRVWGPDGTLIGGNNELALALVMVLPLMRYLQVTAKNRYVRLGLIGAMALTALAILTTFSRGAMLAASVMGLFLWLKARKRKLTLLMMLALLVPAILAFMPEHWYERMSTITDYQQDTSAMGRINAWWFAYYVAADRPLVGGGFEVFAPQWFEVYAPDPVDWHDAHSIYFEVLGEHGFVGLALFLALGVSALLSARRTEKAAAARPDLAWASELSAAVQVALVGYAVGGAFLTLANFDLYYHLVAILIVLAPLVRSELERPVAPEPEPTEAAPKGSMPPRLSVGQRARRPVGS
jgi:probable O-glycosylation ligase (exosortase A-associated)